MHLEGSCHCSAVRFSLECPHPYPFNLCYCSICRHDGYPDESIAEWHRRLGLDGG